MRQAATRMLLAMPLLAVACGPARSDDADVGRMQHEIIGGYADADDPAVVTVGVDHSPIAHCTGTLIAPNLVLTARHCVASTRGGNDQGGVVCGETTFRTQAPAEIFRVATNGSPSYHGTSTIRVPPGGNDICGYDLALIILEAEGVPADVAQPVVPRIDSTPQSGEGYSAVGYGQTTADGGGGGLRMRADANTVNCRGGTCSGAIGQFIEPSEWLGTARTCPGDSGGPAIDDRGRVMGVLSRGPQGCLASVYSDVGSWGDFIIDTAREAAALGRYAPPPWVTTRSSVANPLGQHCSGPCDLGYQCLSADNKSGICVPSCSEDSPACPSDFHCDTKLNACSNLAPAEPSGGGSADGCAVSVARREPGEASWIMALLLLGGLLHGRRRGD